MKPVYGIGITVLSTLTLGCSGIKQENATVLEGPYLGQQPPGLTPKAFAPGLVSSEHRDLSGFFTPDMKTFLFHSKR